MLGGANPTLYLNMPPPVPSGGARRFWSKPWLTLGSRARGLRASGAATRRVHFIKHTSAESLGAKLSVFRQSTHPPTYIRVQTPSPCALLPRTMCVGR